MLDVPFKLLSVISYEELCDLAHTSDILGKGGDPESDTFVSLTFLVYERHSEHHLVCRGER